MVVSEVRGAVTEWAITTAFTEVTLHGLTRGLLSWSTHLKEQFPAHMVHAVPTQAGQRCEATEAAAHPQDLAL